MAFTIVGATGLVGANLARHIRSRGSTCHTVTLDDEVALFDHTHDHLIYCPDDPHDEFAAPADTVDAHVGQLARLLKRGRFETLTYLSSTQLEAFAGGPGSGKLQLDPADPLHLFALAKALAESLCINSGRDGVRVVRLACAYAENLMADTFLHRVLRAARDESSASFDVAPDGEHDFIHIDDVCSVLVHVARRGRRPIYNLASGVNISNAALFEAVARLTRARLKAALPPRGVRAPVIDIRALREDFAIRPVPLQGRLASVLGVPALGAA
jgi:nucleoside-diphosphate-sugar epimerase